MEDVCFARLKLGFSETPALNLSGFLVNCRCFTLGLIKLSEREKLWPQFVKEGGKGEGLHGRVWILHRRAACAGPRGRAVSPEHFIISIIYKEGPHCFPKMLVCVCCTTAGTLLAHVPSKLRKVRGGHRATGSLGVHHAERKQALVSERLATSCSEGRVYRGHCLPSGHPVSQGPV